MATSTDEFRLNNFSLLKDRRVFSFYVVLPLVLGLFFGLSQSGSVPLNSLWAHLVYWPISMFLSWQLIAIGTTLVAFLTRPLKPPLIIVLVIGFALGMALWTPISALRDVALQGLAQEGQTLSYSRLSDLPIALANWILGAILWVLTNYIWLCFFGMRRFGYAADSPWIISFRNWLLSASLKADKDTNEKLSGLTDHHESDEACPRIYKRLQAGDSVPILALVAEDHYTRVVMPSQEELIYIRFSDAMAEMQGHAGFQVHRSYWVSKDAAIDYSERGHLAYIKLSNDQTIPVSRSFRQIVKQTLA